MTSTEPQAAEKPAEWKEEKRKGKTEEVGGFMVLKQMAAGSFARATAGALLIPIDTCKTRLQFQGSMAKGEVRQYKGFVDCFASIYKEEGISAFYRGLCLFDPKSPLGRVVNFGIKKIELFNRKKRSPGQALVHCPCCRSQVRCLPLSFSLFTL